MCITHVYRQSLCTCIGFHNILHTKIVVWRISFLHINAHWIMGLHQRMCIHQHIMHVYVLSIVHVHQRICNCVHMCNIEWYVLSIMHVYQRICKSVHMCIIHVYGNIKHVTHMHSCISTLVHFSRDTLVICVLGGCPGIIVISPSSLMFIPTT